MFGKVLPIEATTEHAVGAALGGERPIAHPRRRIEWRLLRPQPFELRREDVERLLRKAGPDFAHVAQLRSVVEADEKRAEVLAPAFRRGVPPDHEFGLLAHLHFAPER